MGSQLAALVALVVDLAGCGRPDPLASCGEPARRPWGFEPLTPRLDGRGRGLPSSPDYLFLLKDPTGSMGIRASRLFLISMGKTTMF